jgi:hypothetical protein
MKDEAEGAYTQMKDEVQETYDRIQGLLNQGYTITVQLNEYSRREVVLTDLGGMKILASGNTEEEAFRGVLDQLGRGSIEMTRTKSETDEIAEKALSTYFEGLNSGKSEDECCVRLTAGLCGMYSPIEEERAVEIMSTLEGAGSTLPFSSVIRSLALALSSMADKKAHRCLACKCPACEVILGLLSDMNYINDSARRIAESACSSLQEPNQFLVALSKALLTISLSYDHAMKSMRKE